MTKLLMILPLALFLCFIVSCQNKEAMAELEAMKAQAEVEEKNKASFRYMLEETDCIYFTPFFDYPKKK